MKTNQEIAKEVFQGKWGNNLERKRRLTEAGYDYYAIQSIVNAISESMPMNQILEAAYAYDHPDSEEYLVVKGTETLEVEVDLNKFSSVKLNFKFGDSDV